MVITGKVKTDNFSMNYARFGNGIKNLVLIPGLSIKSVCSFAQSVALQYEIFSEEYTVYLFDRRDNAVNGYTIKDMADDIVCSMKKLGIAKTDIFATSQGGIIAMTVAAFYPEMLGRMVLGSTSHIMNDMSSEVCGRWLRLAEQKNEKELINDFAQTVYSEKTIGKYRAAINKACSDISEYEFEQFAVMVRAMFTISAETYLKKIQCRTLVIGSEGDKVFGADSSPLLAEALGADLYMYGREYGHCVYDEAPDYVRRLFDYFQK